jgi:hypothetical protein
LRFQQAQHILTFASLIQSKLFTFYVGEEEKPVVVHAAVIAATSSYFDALINGGMKESEDRSARLADVQSEDFLRFCEYAYRGDYEGNPICDEGDIDDCLLLLLPHARLYCFASTRLIHPLQDLVLKKLEDEMQVVGSMLEDETELSNSVQGYLGLVRYVYSDASNLPERTDGGKVDKLKHLVVRDIVDNLAIIGETEELRGLIEEGGELVWDFWSAVKERHPIQW